jgi:hypothetical protein
MFESREVEAFFRLQFYVSASSDVGYTTGEGWYDCNATARIMVFPPIIERKVNDTLATYRFDRWLPYTDERSLVLTVVVDGPIEVQALWQKSTREAKQNLSAYITEVSVSFLIFTIVMVLSRRQPQFINK